MEGCKKEEGVETKLKRSDERKKIPPRGKRPNTNLKRFLTFALPHFCIRFLYSNPKEFIASKFFFGAGFGGVVGTATFAIGCATSTYFRCTTLIIMPNFLGKEGRAYLVIFVLASIYAGPVANLELSVEEVVRSVACMKDLQINHTKMIWKLMTKPVKQIVEDLVKSAKDLKKNSNRILALFKETEEEMESTDGYDKKKEKEILEREEEAENPTQSTQRKFDIKTNLRCEYVIELGVDKCYDWFDKKHEDCMKTIWLPVLNNLLCLPMKFKFFCNILYLGNTWCRNKLPLEGNFGHLFDKVNATMNNLDHGFSSEEYVKKEERSMFVGLNISELFVIDEIMENINKKKVVMEKIMSFISVILSCSFIFLFVSAYGYTNKYNSDILFDNNYVTTYFRQIDARRRKLKKRFLLPLRRGERNDFIFPNKLASQGTEVKISLVEFLQCIPILILLILSIMFDLILSNIFHIIRKHSQTSYVFSSHHQLEIYVGGDGLPAKLLRNMIGALNTSSSQLDFSANNVCLPNPVSMSFIDYLWSCLPVVCLLSLCFVQVYIYRLRRVVASFYFPKREKRRVLFLYNKMLRARLTYANSKRKQIIRKSRTKEKRGKTLMGALYRQCPWMKFLIRRLCIVCNSSETKDSYMCPTPGCGTVYCQPCWRDMKRFCFACTLYDIDLITDDGESEAEVRFEE
ncbi:E3 ubiquitin-protein ligase DCST1 isoform X2 [Mixophyes fleayi]|uniref:E3 ubiquitin-protein ligase DCST1 isoform X2 n=1 Tax=Mixophyes fleayi TaxID=3061075 RepID=UPI003F4DEA12